MDSIFIDKNLFAINMKRFRKNLNLTQSAVAKELDIPRTSIMNYEKGKYLPEITTLLNICSLYKCSLNELLNIDDSSFMNMPEFFNKIDSNDKIMINKFKEQLNILTELNLKNIKLNNEIKAEKNKLILRTKKLNASQNRYNKLISELEEYKITYNKLINSLINVQNNYLKASSDIDDTRTYFLNSFSNILENANNLIEKIENNTDVKYTNTEDIKKSNLNNVHSNVQNNLITYDVIDNTNYVAENNNIVTVNYIETDIAAGTPCDYADYPSLSQIQLKEKYPLSKENADEFYILKVKGNSMNKIVKDGEKILVHSTNYVNNGTIAVVNIIDESECTLKHYYFDPDKNLITLSPDSYDSDYRDIVYTADEHNIIVQGEYVGKVSDYL